MGMGIVSDAEFDAEIKKVSIREESIPATVIEGTVIDSPTKGRGEGNLAVPDSLRKVIGEESAINGRASALDMAKQFGISPSSVSAYANGVTSTATYDKPDVGLTNHITQAKEKISKRARAKLMSALHHITPAKLAEAKVRDIAGVARDMSAVIKNLEPDTPRTSGHESTSPTFVFYAPQYRKEESFDTVPAKE